MKPLIFTALALRDFQDIHDYIAKDNPDAALEFIERLEKRCKRLCEMPGVGRKRDELRPNTRSATEGDYVLFYRKLNGGIEILRVVHGKRDMSNIAL